MRECIRLRLEGCDCGIAEARQQAQWTTASFEQLSRVFVCCRPWSTQLAIGASSVGKCQVCTLQSITGAFKSRDHIDGVGIICESRQHQSQRLRLIDVLLSQEFFFEIPLGG